MVEEVVDYGILEKGIRQIIVQVGLEDVDGTNCLFRYLFEAFTVV